MLNNSGMSNFISQAQKQNAQDFNYTTSFQTQPQQIAQKPPEKADKKLNKVDIAALSAAALALASTGVCLYKLHDASKLTKSLQGSLQTSEKALKKAQGDLASINAELQKAKGDLGVANGTITSLEAEKDKIINNLLFPNGVENTNFMQSNIGDCYLLSSLYGMSRNKKGQELLKDMVTINKDGNFVVTFFNKSPIVIRPDELKGQSVIGKSGRKEIRKAVYGDMGIQAIERAYGRHRKLLWHSGHSLTTIDGGKCADALDIMSALPCKIHGSGSKGTFKTQGKAVSAILDDISDNFDSRIVCVATPPSNFGVIKKVFGTETHGWMDSGSKFPCGHAYTIAGIDKAHKKVTIINPHNTTKPETVSYDRFEQIFGRIYEASV